ncbi:uncharacterized protein [Penaeus vannamei]|uniref:uncharacterized protein n=1 Tax=Penaeus vannamei TaxID=6689 RepID=UPI00387F6ED0
MAPWHKKNQEVKYIYDLPYTERKLLCNILDVNNVWEKLGGKYMGFSWSDLDEFRRAERCGESPTNRMLQAWGQQNHTVADLFSCLLQMEHFQAMGVLKPCIPAKYHVLFDDAETRLTAMFVEDRSTINVVTRRSEAIENTRHSPNGIMHAPAPISSTPPSAAAHGYGMRKQAMVNPAPQVPQMQQVRQESGMSALGACALSGSLSHKYNPENLDHGNSRISHQPASPKVPETLLNPKPSAPTLGSMRPMVPMHQQPVMHMEKKINNDEALGIWGEVSCDDNNHKSLPKYDFDQEYADRVARKLGLEGRDQMRTDSNNGIMPHHPRRKEESLGLASSPGQASSLPSPPSPLPHAHAAELNGNERLRRISCTSDTANECNVPVIPYKELEEATAVWNTDNLLGRGGFGTVFRGTWKNTQVAIKRIDPQGNAALDSKQLHVTQSFDELKRLQSYRHDNILQVYGYSADPDQPLCLVYQYMPNGSVEDRLQCRRIGGSPTKALTWWQRYRIAWCTARGLQYLHTVKDKPLIHGDVKSANILLDQNYEAKLGDFGLAREGKSQVTSMKVSRVHGTKPYLPADYLRSKKLSVKVDTYSYGIVLFELCTGLRAYDEKRERGKFLKELVDDTANEETLRDRNAGPELDGEVFKMLFKLGRDCVKLISTKRPDMTTVFKELESFGQVLDRNAQARKISLGETSSGATTPYMLQIFHDTAGSMQSPSVSPSTQPSLGASTVPTYPSPSSPSFLPPHSPVPSVVPGSSVMPHYPQHPIVFPNAPMLVNGGVPYRNQYPHAGSPAWKPVVAGNMYAPPHGLPMHMPQINVSPPKNDSAGQDPPSYSETILKNPGGAVGGACPVSPLLPQVLGLDLNAKPSGNTTTSSVDSESDYGSSESSLIATTTHNLGYANGYYNAGGAAAAPVIPTVVHPAALAYNNNPGVAITPLITELGMKSAEQPTLSESSPKLPSAVGKKSFL